MGIVNAVVVAGFAALVIVPLACEYADLRGALGMSRTAALGTTMLVVPALLVGIALALPLSGRPALQWTTTILVTLVVYSLAAAAARAASRPVEARR